MLTQRRVIALACLALAAVAAASCGRSLQRTLAGTRQPPQVQLTSTSLHGSGASDVAHRLSWTATALGGRVDHFVYAVNPRSVDRVDEGWSTTAEREHVLAWRRATPGAARPAVAGGAGFQLFAVRAVDDAGTMSSPATRAFFDEDVAPTVRITAPLPSPLIAPTVAPSVWVHWQGSDPDGPGGLPARYKYRLFRPEDTPQWNAWLANPDSLRREFAPAFAGWDSIPGDSTRVRLTGLVPNSEYLFVITALDAQGAYDPVFSLSKNMLRMFVGFPGSLGPQITMFNSYFSFTYPSGGMCTDTSCVVHVQAPADQPLTVNWYAYPSIGARMAGYRWALDIADITDETPRHNKHDLSHWSAWGPVTSATIGPFPGAVPHRLYIEAQDENELVSLGMVEARFVQPSFDKDLLVVIDTRLKPDQRTRVSPDSLQPPSGIWPTQAELDTFLFAVGGVRWRMTPDGTLSPTGLFKGYSYDTLGTRRGLEDPTIPLDVLGRYRHVVWITDGPGSEMTGYPALSPTPMTTLRYMSQPNRQSTLASWVAQGGKLWAVGGGFGNATNVPWNNLINDVGGQRVYSSVGTRPDLTPGRFMYDLAHWRSEFRVTTTYQVDIARSPFPIASEGGAPNYGLLPAELGCRDPGSEPLWPFRSIGDFYGCPSLTASREYSLEYLSLPDTVLEAKNPSPRHQHDIQALDTLMVAVGDHLPAPGANPAVDRIVNPVMTCYHGGDNGMVVFSGFSLWDWRSTDTKQLVDGVLQGIWGLNRARSEGPVVQRVPRSGPTRR